MNKQTNEQTNKQTSKQTNDKQQQGRSTSLPTFCFIYMVQSISWICVSEHHTLETWLDGQSMSKICVSEHHTFETWLDGQSMSRICVSEHHTFETWLDGQSMSRISVSEHHTFETWLDGQVSCHTVTLLALATVPLFSYVSSQALGTPLCRGLTTTSVRVSTAQWWAVFSSVNIRFSCLASLTVSVWVRHSSLLNIYRQPCEIVSPVRTGSRHLVKTVWIDKCKCCT